MADQRSVPEIRFKGFSGEWEDSKLAEMVSFSKGRGYSKSDLTDVGTPIILYGRMYTNYKTLISEVNTYTTPKLNSVFSQGNEIIIPSSGESAEDIARASVIGNSNIIIGGDLNVLLPTPDVDSVFLAYNISNGNPKRELEKRAQGKTVVHLHNSDLQELLIYYPKRLEQSQIGTFFQSLDSLLTLHQRKYDKLTTVKKAMFEKMFPKDGADAPEIRFKGFAEKWENRQLGSILSERKILQKISDDAPILAFAAGQGVIDRSERKSNNRDHLTLDQANKIYLLTELNDIVYNPSNLKYGAIDRNKHGRGVISPIYVTFTTEEEPSFIELIVKSEKFKLRALQFEEGTVVKRQSVKPENLLELEIALPNSLDEQKKIGLVFEHIDALITLQQRELDKLKKIKKACLEKMFV